MPQDKSLQLFKQGQAAEVKLFFLGLLCIVLMVVDSQWGLLSPARRIISTALHPFQQAALWPRNWVNQVYDWSNAVELSKQQLIETERQKIELAQISVHAAQMASENSQLRRLLGIKNSVPINSVAVEILYAAANPLHHTLVLTKGSNDGIKPGMPLIGEGGVVGQIQRVTPNTSEVALITDERISIPALVLRNGLRVIVFGSGVNERVEVRYLSTGADIKVGDNLVTSGVGGVYPAGLAIGKVIEIENNSSQGFVRAFVEPAAHPERFLHFLVLLLEPNNPDNDNAEKSPEGFAPDTSLLNLPKDGAAKSYAMRANNATLSKPVSASSEQNTNTQVRNRQDQVARKLSPNSQRNPSPNSQRNPSPNSQRNTSTNTEHKASAKLSHTQTQATRREAP